MQKAGDVRFCGHEDGNLSTGTEVINHKSEVVVVEQYEQVEMGKPKSAAGRQLRRILGKPPSGLDATFFQIGGVSVELCGKWLWECGIACGCKKRHLTVYKLRNVREPVNFTLAVPKHDGKAARRSARQQHASANQRPRTQRRCESLAFYMLTPKLRQEIEQGVRAV